MIPEHQFRAIAQIASVDFDVTIRNNSIVEVGGFYNRLNATVDFNNETIMVLVHIIDTEDDMIVVRPHYTKFDKNENNLVAKLVEVNEMVRRHINEANKVNYRIDYQPVGYWAEAFGN